MKQQNRSTRKGRVSRSPVFGSTVIKRAAIDALEPRRMFHIDIPLGEVGLGHRVDLAVPDESTSYTFTLSDPTTISAYIPFGTARLLRNGQLLAEGKSIDRSVVETGSYSLAVDSRLGATITFGTSNMAAPTRVEADVWGGGAIHLNWDDNTDDESQYRVDRWTHLGWRRSVRVGEDATAAVVDNLVPDAETTYRVSAVDKTGISIRSANTVTARTAAVDTSGWYKVKITQGMTQAYAGWVPEDRPEQGQADTLKIVPGLKDNGSTTQSTWVYAGDWHEAVYNAAATYNMVNGVYTEDPAKVRVTFSSANYNAGDSVMHSLDNGGDFKIGTGAELKANGNISGFKLNPSDDIKYIALEDSYGDIDRDYDDFYWKVETEYFEAAAPEGLKGVAQFEDGINNDPTLNEVDLDWEYSDELPFKFEVQRRSITDNNDWSTVIENDPDVQGEDTDMLPGQYEYRVRAGLGNQVSDWSSTADVNVWPPGYYVGFDGTWQVEADNTAVFKTSEKFRSEFKDYNRGVGNEEDYEPFDQTWQLIHATDSMNRVVAQYNALTLIYQQSDRQQIPVDLIGYSRGSFEAVQLANMLIESGVPDLSSATPMTRSVFYPGFNHGMGQTVQVPYTGYTRRIPVNVRSVTIVSAVNMTGVSTELRVLSLGILPDFHLGWDDAIAGTTARVLQFRDNEPDSLIFPETRIGYSEYMDEHSIDVTHSQIGTNETVWSTVKSTLRSWNVPIDVG